MVMIEIGKLTAKVDRLIADVDKHDGKLETLSTKAAMIQGGIVVLCALIAFLGWLIPQLVSGKVAALLQAAANAHK